MRSGWEGFGSVWCGPKYFGSVQYGSGRFDTILGESIVETAMFTAPRRNPGGDRQFAKAEDTGFSDGA